MPFDLASAQAQQQAQQAAMVAPPAAGLGVQRPQMPQLNQMNRPATSMIAPAAPAPAGFDNPAVSQMLRAPAAPGNAAPVSNFAAGPQMQGNPTPRLSAPMGGAAVSGLGQPQPMGKPMPLGAPGLGGFGGQSPKLGGKGGAAGGGKSKAGAPAYGPSVQPVNRMRM